MIIDFHTHVFPPYFKEERNLFFGEEPHFEVLYRSPNARVAENREILESMDAEEIDKSVIFGFPWEKTDHFRRHNDYVIETVQQYPERFIGFCTFSLFSAQAPEEAIRCLEAGLSGVGELAVYHSGFSQEKIAILENLMEICAHYDVPLLLHTNEPVGHQYPGKTSMILKDLYEFLKTYPDNKIILAHWGGGIFFYGLMKEVREVLKNVWFDTAASPFLYQPDIYRMAGEIIGFERILFGSDFPLIKPGRYFKEMASSGISENSINRIKGENALSLLGISA
ncbi:amidohydrolase family protein [Thermodesulfobacteriota bacterium]